MGVIGLAASTARLGGLRLALGVALTTLDASRMADAVREAFSEPRIVALAALAWRWLLPAGGRPSRVSVASLFSVLQAGLVLNHLQS